MPVTPTNQSKNLVTPSNSTKSGFFLNYGVTGTNQSKNTISPTNQSKS